jgi:hypothetical protein
MEVKERIFGAAHIVSKQKTPLIKRSQNFYILVAETLLNYDDQSVRLKTLADCIFDLHSLKNRGDNSNNHGIEYLSIHKIESVPAYEGYFRFSPKIRKQSQVVITGLKDNLLEYQFAFMTLKTTDIDSMRIFLEKRDGDPSSFQYGLAPFNSSQRGEYIYHEMMKPEREKAKSGIFPSRIKAKKMEDKQRSSVCCGHSNNMGAVDKTKSDPTLSNVISYDLIMTTGGEENDHPTVTSSVCCEQIDNMAYGNKITSMEVADNCSEGELKTTNLPEISLPKSSDKDVPAPKNPVPSSLDEEDLANCSQTKWDVHMDVDKTKSDSPLSVTNVTSLTPENEPEDSRMISYII